MPCPSFQQPCMPVSLHRLPPAITSNTTRHSRSTSTSTHRHMQPGSLLTISWPEISPNSKVLISESSLLCFVLPSSLLPLCYLCDNFKSPPSLTRMDRLHVADQPPECFNCLDRRRAGSTACSRLSGSPSCCGSTALVSSLSGSPPCVDQPPIFDLDLTRGWIPLPVAPIAQQPRTSI
jgi:hypothetical protein